MPRLSVPFSESDHKAVRVRCAELGIPQAEVARRLLLAWLSGHIVLPEEGGFTSGSGDVAKASKVDVGSASDGSQKRGKRKRNSRLDFR